MHIFGLLKVVFSAMTQKTFPRGHHHDGEDATMESALRDGIRGILLRKERPGRPVRRARTCEQAADYGVSRSN